MSVHARLHSTSYQLTPPGLRQLLELPLEIHAEIKLMYPIYLRHLIAFMLSLKGELQVKKKDPLFLSDNKTTFSS